MNIAGFQSLSLLDYPEKPCSIIFTQGCVFRCSYCHNPELIPLGIKCKNTGGDILTRLERRKKIVDAVCITGGEPTLQEDIIDFIRLLKERNFFVKLDTNGVSPGKIQTLIAEHLIDAIAMDIKAPWERYGEVIRAGTSATVEACRNTFALIQNSDIDHEFRTTVLPGVHTQDDFFEIAGYLKSNEKYFIQKTSFQKTLQPLNESIFFDGEEVTVFLQKKFPHIFISYR